MDFTDRLTGVLLGTAVGDAIGLPREGLSRRRAERIFGGAPLRHRFLLGHGMTSDDTEHTCMTAQALLASKGDPAAFARSLAWKLRWWLLGLPAGVGMATARGIIRLWLGFSPERSGVWSAGNGPAMRAAVMGLYAKGDKDRLAALVRASTRLTHSDPAAEQGAAAVAWAAWYGASRGPEGVDADEFLSLLRERLSDAPIVRLIEQAVDHVRRGADVAEFTTALGLGNGVSGYINHTVPVAIYCWLRSPGDFRRAVEQVVLLGGDTDTTGAIVGALVGASAGEAAIPRDWLDGLAEWPRTVGWMRQLAGRLAVSCDPDHQDKPSPLHLFWPGVLLRNMLFLVVVLVHGVRRLLPPY